jgi:AcrR family transcriptional regulator
MTMGRPKEVADEQIAFAARRCFLERGAGVSAADIAHELGVSHKTLLNRFGSKEALMIAALEPPKEVPWVAAFDSGPDARRPMGEQLAEHVKTMYTYFQGLQTGRGTTGRRHRAWEGLPQAQRRTAAGAGVPRARCVATARLEPGMPRAARRRDVGLNSPWRASRLGVHRGRLRRIDRPCFRRALHRALVERNRRWQSVSTPLCRHRVTRSQDAAA